MSIRTENLFIYSLEESHAEFLLALMNTEGFHRFIGDRGIRTVEESADYIRRYFLPLEQSVGYGYYCLENSQGAKVGLAGFLQKDYLRHPDLGFALLPNHYGKGYAYEACQALLSYVESQFKQFAIDAVTDVDNIASQALLNKLGFVRVQDLLGVEQGDAKTVVYHRNIN